MNELIRFLAHSVKKGSLKARVYYSAGEVLIADADGIKRRATAKAVTIYAKDYDGILANIFTSFLYQNNTNTITDYFEKGRVCLREGHPLYLAALERANLNEAKSAKRRAKSTIR